MKKNLLLSALALVAVVACEKTPAPELQDTVKIEPIITRATMVNFEQGDMIGLNITKADATVHAENACLTYDADAQVFTGDLKWYAEGGDACTLMAFYPYNQAGFPSSFTVAADQSASAGASDFMVAYKENVKPQSQGVAMQFKHYLSQILILVDNQAGATIDNITIKGLVPTAAIAKEGSEITVSADETAVASDIIAEPLEAGLKYRAIIVPQTAPFGVAVEVKDGSTLVTGVTEVTLKPSYQYTLNVTVLADEAKVAVAGEILAWENGGNLVTGDDGIYGGGNVIAFEEFDDYFNYAGLRYDKVTLANGQVWMKEPLAYIPDGCSVSDDPATGLVLYPYSSDGTDITVLKDAESIKANGYLYRYDALFGAPVTNDNFDTFEGLQGICPAGWHIPTRNDWLALCGNSNKSVYLEETGIVNDATALFYDSAYSAGTVAKFNEGGFNFTFSGSVGNNMYSKLIIDSSVCNVEEFYGKNRMTYLACSSPSRKDGSMMFAGMTTFTSANPTGKVSLAEINLQKGAAQVRCIKD